MGLECDERGEERPALINIDSPRGDDSFDPNAHADLRVGAETG